MKKSIKWKITIIFNIVVVCCIGCILLFNTLFLEKIYIFEKENVLTSTYHALDSGIIKLYKDGYTLTDLFKQNKNKNENEENSFVIFLRELQERYNVNIVLMDKNNKVYSLFQNSNRFDDRIMNYIFKDVESDPNIQIMEKNEYYTIAINASKDIPQKSQGYENRGPSEYYESPGPSKKDNRQKIRRRLNVLTPPNRNSDIECFGFLSDNETAFFMVTSILSIREPVRLFNRILILLSIFVIIVGSFVIYIISNNITLPLLKMSEISQKISHLDFEKKCEVKTEDEIGVLGNSMNEMSEKLEKSIKELKNANFQLKKDIEQKEQLDLMRQEFIANVSHELKTPIALIQGYAEGLETDTIVENEEQRAYYLNVIKDETEKMNIMVRQLLDLSALERGMADLEIVRVNLYEVIEGLLNSQEIKIQEANVKVIVNVDKNCYVWADGYKVEEVIRNYFTNAMHYVDDNKLIKIYTKKLSDEKIRLYVYNSGMKLSDIDREKIWEKFYKVDKARTREYGGTGLGLSIVKAIAEQHLTTCGCESIDGDKNNKDGMAFYFDFNVK